MEPNVTWCRAYTLKLVLGRHPLENSFGQGLVLARYSFGDGRVSIRTPLRGSRGEGELKGILREY